jgi:hypothetical protein
MFHSFSGQRRVRDFGRKARPASRVRPSVEALEDRTVPSTFTVTNLLDSGPGSLRAAVDAANTAPGADVIKFAGGLKGTITLASELGVTDDLTIISNANKVTVSGGGATRVFHVSGAATDLAINGLTIANGLASVPGGNAFGGGLLNEGAHVSLSHVVLANNQAVGLAAGGGAVANLGGRFTADHTAFLGNSYTGTPGPRSFGGAVYGQNAILDIEHSTFSGNQATGGNTNGGAVGVVGGSQVTLAHCSFVGNQALGDALGGGFGGAIAAQRNGLSASPTLAITHCSFTGNQALVRAATSSTQTPNQGNGGAISVEDEAVATVSHCTFDANRARGGDGGGESAGGNGGNASGSFGGAIFNNSAILSVSHSSFTGNETRGGNGGQGGSGGKGGNGNFGIGGAIGATIRNTTSSLPTTQIDHCSFVGNRAFGGDGGAGANGGDALGGGAFNARPSPLNQPSTTLTFSDCTVSGNLATGGAGGVGGNGGNALGGGIFNGNPPPAPGTPDRVVVLIGTRVTGNQAVGGAAGAGGTVGLGQGGGLYNQTGATAYADVFTAITGNTASTSDDDVFGVVTPI